MAAIKISSKQGAARRGDRPVRQRKHGRAAAGAGGYAFPEHAFTLAGHRHSLHPPVRLALDANPIKPLTLLYLRNYNYVTHNVSNIKFTIIILSIITYR